MGSAARVAGFRHENARAARRRLRKEATIVREAFALERYAAGDTYQEIAAAMADKFGSCSVAHLSELIPRALARFASMLDEQTIEQARALYMLRLEGMVRAYTPVALGRPFDPTTMTEGVAPDVRAGDLLLKVLDRIAETTGARERPKRGDLTINVQLPTDPDSARKAVLEELRREADKLRTVEGRLVEVGTDLRQLTTGEGENDALPPPIEEDEAA